jgi:acyl transferase domain-containing protein
MITLHALDQISSTDDDVREGNEPLAIIGMGCRFPGAKDVNAFWNLLCSGIDTITEVPADRFNIEEFYDPRPGTPGKTISRWGGFLEDISSFDAAFFGISPREASTLDPQTRLLLQVAWEALEDAGEVLEQLAGSQTSLFVGGAYNDYLDLQIRDSQNIGIYVLSGGWRSTVSGRVSSILDLRGPSLTIDTACSSSLVATHLACQSLWSGECQLALAAGVNLLMEPEITVGFSQASMLAPDGRCKAFDALANGFTRSDGIGLIVLKPLARARADGNPIYAIIRGSAVGNDGDSSGSFMTPGIKGQEQVIRNAYHHAGIVPGRVRYIEAHGTGTSVGDPIEVAALSAVLQEGRVPGDRCLLGSVKTNIGHTEAAAGIAGLIKTALILKHRLVPPNLHLQQPNPRIPWQTTPLTIADHLQPWPESEGPAIAGVSSFGISGTNAHVVLEEAPPCQVVFPEQTTHQPEARLLTLSARSSAALTSLAQQYKALFTSSVADHAGTFYDICYSASVRRTHHDHRLAVVGRSPEEMSAGLDAFLSETVSPSVLHGRCNPDAQHKIVFMFPGQGSQWSGMGRRLLEQEPVFRVVLERCEQAFHPYVDWSLLDALTTHDEARSGLHTINQIQPIIFAIQVALAALWRSWGIYPDRWSGIAWAKLQRRMWPGFSRWMMLHALSACAVSY